MKSFIVTGAILVVIGLALLGQYSYTTQESVFKLGPIQATAEKTHTFSAPPPLSWALIAGGVIVLVFGATRKR
jgi:hypothetical protein